MTITPRFISITGGRDNGSGGIAGATVNNAAALPAAAASADTALGVVTGADQTAVEAAVALLEADAATPTQAHVNALRTVWNTLKTDAAAAKVKTAALTGTGILQGYDFLVGYDVAAVISNSKFRALLREAERAAARGGLTG